MSLLITETEPMPVIPLCDKCDCPGVFYNDDGQFLCEDCAFEAAVEETTSGMEDTE